MTVTKLTVVLAVTSCYVEPPQAPRAEARACHLGAPLTAQPVLEVPGYPVKIASYDDATRKAARAALDAMPLHELTDAELVARWGGDPDREVAIDWMAREYRCDAEGGAGCAKDAPIEECVRLPAIMHRATVESWTGLRRVVEFVIPCQRGCTVRWIVPCTDAVTGELLPTSCQPMEQR